MTRYFPKTYSCFCGNAKFELDLFDYETKSDTEKANIDLDSLKSEVDKLDIDEINNVSPVWRTWDQI